MRLKSITKILPYFVVRWLILRYNGDECTLTPCGGTVTKGRYYEIDLGEALFVSDKEHIMKHMIRLKEAIKKDEEKLRELEREVGA